MTEYYATYQDRSRQQHWTGGQPAMADSLPDDVLLEILGRLDSAADLFRCAMACKRLRGLVADPSFLRCRWPKNSFAGFFIMERPRDMGAKVLVPMPGSPLGAGRRNLSSFVPAVPAGFLSRAAPLAAAPRHGLLLVRLLPNCRPPSGGHCGGPVSLAVCDLLAGTCHQLPALPFAALSPGASACAVLTNADFCRHRSSFNVVIITPGWRWEGQHEYDLHSFSYATARHWSSRTERFWFGASGSFCHTGAIVVPGHGGSTAHWLFRGKTPVVTPQCYYYLFTYHPEDGGRVSMTGLPAAVMTFPESRAPCLSLAMDGTLSVLLMGSTTDHDPYTGEIRYGDRVEIWTQQQQQQQESGAEEEDDGAASPDDQWRCARTVELMQPERMKSLRYRTREEHWPYIMGERHGTVLVNDADRRVYAADLETGAMAKVTGWPSLRPEAASDVLPLEMDWPAFFASRLAVRPSSRLPSNP